MESTKRERGTQSLYQRTKNYVRTRHEGVRQGCILSPLLFSLVLDEAIKKTRKEAEHYEVGNWRMENIRVLEICYADDMVMIAKNEKILNKNIVHLQRQLEKINMKINSSKTKTMVISREETKHEIKLGSERLEQVGRFKYLGSVFAQDGRIDEEVKERRGAAGRFFNSIKNTFLGNKEIPTETKVQIYKKVAVPIITYGSESWTTTERQRNKLSSTEMRFLRKIEGKTIMDRVRNTEYREKLDIKPIETKIEEGQMRWFGHVMRMGEERTTRRVFEARPKKKRGKGRPRKIWNEEVKNAVERREIKWEETRTMTQDRRRWREAWKREARE